MRDYVSAFRGGAYLPLRELPRARWDGSWCEFTQMFHSPPRVGFARCSMLDARGMCPRTAPRYVRGWEKDYVIQKENSDPTRISNSVPHNYNYVFLVEMYVAIRFTYLVAGRLSLALLQYCTGNYNTPMGGHIGLISKSPICRDPEKNTTKTRKLL